MHFTLGLSMNWIFFIVVTLIYIGYTVYRYLKTKKILTTLSEDTFKEGFRKGQLIDIRPQKDFDGGHIWGARNLPFLQLKQRKSELRKDMPVYLYCQAGVNSQRAAWLLHKAGYKEIYDLKGGFKLWTGKIKKTTK